MFYMIIVNMSDGKIEFAAESSAVTELYMLAYPTLDRIIIIKDFGTTPPTVGDTYNLTWQERRKAAYHSEADPLFIAYQGQLNDASSTQTEIDAAKQAWLDKRNEIKQRYPKV